MRKIDLLLGGLRAKRDDYLARQRLHKREVYQLALALALADLEPQQYRFPFPPRIIHYRASFWDPKRGAKWLSAIFPISNKTTAEVIAEFIKSWEQIQLEAHRRGLVPIDPAYAAADLPANPKDWGAEDWEAAAAQFTKRGKKVDVSTRRVIYEGEEGWEEEEE